MDIEESYDNKENINYQVNSIIYSKSLIEEKVPYWNNRFLNLKEITSIEKLEKKEV